MFWPESMVDWILGIGILGIGGTQIAQEKPIFADYSDFFDLRSLFLLSASDALELVVDAGVLLADVLPVALLGHGSCGLAEG